MTGIFTESRRVSTESLKDILKEALKRSTDFSIEKGEDEKPLSRAIGCYILELLPCREI